MASAELLPPGEYDEPEPRPGAAMRLRRDELMSLLGVLGESSGMGELRRMLIGVQARLDDRQDQLHANDDSEAVIFTAGYLSSELAQIGAAMTIERARYYIERLRKAVVAERTAPINEINLNRWKEYDDILTDSLWLIDRRDSSGAHSAGYWGNFIPQIPNQLMRRYTRRGEWVIDPFAGSGTTLIEGQRLGRNTLGVELQPHMVERTQAVIESEPNRYGVVSQVAPGDSTRFDFKALLEANGARSAQLVLMHPPYHDIIHFSDDPRDLSNAASAERFFKLLGQVVENVASVLDRERYLALVIGDKYARGEWSPLGFQAMQEVQQRGFTLRSIIVKNIDGTAGKRSQKELWRYRALLGGFYVFKHEYIFLFRKR